MNLATLETLIAREQALIEALDSDDVAAIERATDAFRGALSDFGTLAPAPAPPSLKPRVGEAMALADAARTRVAFLADATQRRIERLAAATGRAPATPVYGSNGRLR